MVPHSDASEVELRDYADVLRRRWTVVALAVVVVGGVAFAVSMTQTARYRAEAEVLVRQPPTAVSLGLDGGPGTVRSMANEVRRAEATAVVRAVRDAVGDEPALSVRADANADVLVFTAESTDPELAASAATRYAEAFVEQRRESLVAEYMASGEVLQQREVEITAMLNLLELEREAAESAVAPNAPNRQAELARIAAEYDRRAASLEAQRQRYTELLDSLLLSAELAQGSGAQVIRPAEVPASAFAPTTLRNLVVAMIVGLVLGVGAAFLLEYLDTSLRSPDDLELASGGLVTLAVVPDLAGWRTRDRPHIVTLEQPQSPSAEAYRGLRTSVQFLGIDRTIRTVGFTSPQPGDGKTTSAANLAVASARAGQRVALIDCDLRQPRVHEFFDLDNAKGFTSVLLGEVRLEVAAHRFVDEPNLVIVTSGPVPPDPSELLAGKRARSLVAAVADQADLVIIDAPPVLAVADPLIVAGMVDGMILVASAGRTDRTQVTRAVEQLQLVNAPMLGTVLNRDTSARSDTYGYGGYTAPAERPGRTRRMRKRTRRPGSRILIPDVVDDSGDATPDWGALPSIPHTR
jgi:polysaccharide biosynthesis transport protein